jgi:hypothetical protein
MLELRARAGVQCGCSGVIAGPCHAGVVVNALVVPLFSTVLCFSAGLAGAQSPAPTPVAQPATSLQLQVPTRPVEAASDTETSDNAVVDAQDSRADDDAEHDGRRGPQLHGSVTAGIGYSKGYGTSTMEAADLDISGQSDSGRTYDVQIHVMQSKGLGFGPYNGYYGPRYRD